MHTFNGEEISTLRSEIEDYLIRFMWNYGDTYKNHIINCGQAGSVRVSRSIVSDAYYFEWVDKDKVHELNVVQFIMNRPEDF